MIDFSLSWLPFVVVAVANFAMSWLYYSPAVAGIFTDKFRLKPLVVQPRRFLA